MNPKRDMPPGQAMRRLESLCGRAEHSVGELRVKLRSWGVKESDARQIIADLASRRFVDDRRFAGAYVHDKVCFAHWGRYKIAQGLMAKYIDSSTIREALDAVDPDDYHRALNAVLTAKLRTMARPLAYEDRVKVIKHAMSRGFEPDIIRSVLANILKRAEIEDE